MPGTEYEAVRQQQLTEHEELKKQIDELNSFWQEVNELGEGPKCEEMAYRVKELRKELKDHFKSEATEGYLASPLIQSSRFATQAENLGQQHPQLLRMLDRFITELQKCEFGSYCWKDVKSDFDEFLRTLNEHESSETELMKTALQELKQE